MKLSIHTEAWPLKQVFRISSCDITHSYIIRVTLKHGDIIGHGEAEAHDMDARELNLVADEIRKVQDSIESGTPWSMIYPKVQHLRARNALDCMFWDFAAKKSGVSAWAKAGLTKPKSLVTAYSIGIDNAENMAKTAKANRHRKLLKIKLGHPDGDVERIEKIHRAAPNADLIVDANEGWSFRQLTEYAPKFQKLGVKLIEQPLPRDQDAELETYISPVPLCADESCHTRVDLPNVIGRYQFVNIKLDKTGGLTEALLLAQDAKKSNLRLMTGCMVGTSLAMAPAMLLGSLSEFVDLDGPLLLNEDRENGLKYSNPDSLVFPATDMFWGEGS